ncbi:MAG: AAA family ATPase, partial [Candidatus Paceibacterota bacterium]
MSVPEVKLRKLSLLNFRGAKDLLDLDLGRDCRSCAIFGYNGEGKSTITQAIEWFYMDRIARLKGEGCVTEDLINLASEPGDETSVNIVFSKNELNCSKTFDKQKRRSRLSNSSAVFVDYFEKDVRYDRIYLDQQSILWFLSQTKGAKKGSIAEIVGYEEIIKAKSTVSAVLRNLERHARLADAQRRLSQNQGLLTKEVYGEAVNDIETLLKKSEELLKVFNITDHLTSISELDNALKKAFDSLPSQKRAQEKIELDNLQRKLQGLNNSKDFIAALESCIVKFNGLINDRESLSNLNLDDLLRQAERVLKSTPELKECPLCEQTIIDKDALLRRVIERYQKLIDIREKLNINGREFSAFLNVLQQIERETFEIIQNLDLKKVNYDASLREYAEAIGNLKKQLDKQYKSRETIAVDLDVLNAIIGKVGLSINDINSQVSLRIQSLTTTREEEIKHEAYQKISRGKSLVLENMALQKEIEVIKNLILSMRLIESQMLEMQNATMSKILELLSQDVNKFFCYLNRKDKIKDVKLVLTGEEGIEFCLEFYDNVASPPQKYLSESQFNSLGIAFFLAAVKKFNKVNKFFVLDDVLVSFDRNYRTRLLDLLAEEFSDYQILLFTHEEYWYELIRRKFTNWVFKEVSWSFENGIRFKDSIADQLLDLSERHAKGEDVGNNLRIYIESLLKD